MGEYIWEYLGGLSRGILRVSTIAHAKVCVEL